MYKKTFLCQINNIYYYWEGGRLTCACKCCDGGAICINCIGQIQKKEVPATKEELKTYCQDNKIKVYHKQVLGV